MLLIFILFGSAHSTVSYIRFVKTVSTDGINCLSVYLIFEEYYDPFQIAVNQSCERFNSEDLHRGKMAERQQSPHGRSASFLWGKKRSFIFLFHGNKFSIFPMTAYELGKDGHMKQLHGLFWQISGFTWHIFQNSVTYIIAAIIPFLYFLFVRYLWRKTHLKCEIMAVPVSICISTCGLLLLYVMHHFIFWNDHYRLFIPIIVLFTTLVAFWIFAIVPNLLPKWRKKTGEQRLSSTP